MSHSTQEFRNVLRAARRAGTPLVAVRTNDPASAIAQVSASVADKKNTPILTWDILNGVAGRNDPAGEGHHAATHGPKQDNGEPRTSNQNRRHRILLAKQGFRKLGHADSGSKIVDFDGDDRVWLWIAR